MNNITLYGADWCADCRRAKSYLKKNNINFKFIDVDIDEHATQKVESINNGKRIIPTIVLNNKSYTNPNNATLSSILGINPEGQLILFGADWCPDCRRAKSYLSDNSVNFQFVDIDKHDWAIEKVEAINNGKRSIPTLILNGTSYTNPNNLKLKELLNIDSKKENKVYDSIIIGGGAAGLTTAIYAQRDKFSTLILEQKNIGGNAFLTEKIENYPGFDKISGPKLMERMEHQAKTYGAEIRTGEEVSDIKKKDDLFELTTIMGTYLTKTVVLCTGSIYKKTGIPNEKDLIGSGIHFCATCDGAFYKDKEVVVIGGGNSALEESIFLANFCKSVKIINRSEKFKASNTYIEKLDDIDNIEVYNNSTPIEFTKTDNNLFKGIVIKDNTSGEQKEITADGAFVFIGLTPNTKNFKKVVDLNNKGLVITKNLAQTSVEGIFAAGDCREGAIAQVAAATGEGVFASYGIKNFLK